MSLRILLRDQPQRSLALVTDTHALVFRHSHLTPNFQTNAASTKSSTPRCMVEFSSSNNVDLTDYKTIRTLGAHGTLGLININTDVFLCVISGAALVATVRPGETVQRIVSVEFYCLNNGNYDHELHDEINRLNTDDISSDGFDYGHGFEQREPSFEHPCLVLKKLLSSGTFYYSVDFDLTNRLQNRASNESTFDVDSLDEDFLWNSYMIGPLVQFRSRLAPPEQEALDASRFLTLTIRGYVSTITVPVSASPVKAIHSNYPSSLTLISRLSCRRAGTRFNSRGIDDNGNVANFVETETVFWFPSGLCFSYAQIRGSVPVFWEQATGLLPGQQKITITRSPEATQPAFDKHFEHLEINYGTIYILNLLSESKPGEVELTQRYRSHVRYNPLYQSASEGTGADHRLLQESQFDFHAETKGPGGYEAASMVKHLIQDSAEGFAYYLSDILQPDESRPPNNKALNQRSVVVLKQEGVFRTNCLDCLDRTNLIQTIISQMALESFLKHRGERASSDFWMRHSTLWADNGDSLSRIYAGTGALKSSFTRNGKMSLAGAIADARKSATRIYINNFADKGRQNTIDMLLGRLMDQPPVQLYDPINDYVTAELHKRINTYSTTKTVHIWVGTFNLNGRGNGIKEDLSSWLCPEISQPQQSAEIVAVGFQEIVELSPQQIMSTDPARRQQWESAVGRTLNENARKRGSEEYVLLRSGQLVGAALIIFVKSHVLGMIKNVEGSLKKTGMSGVAGNKGAVAIRMDCANTRICFVTAHLAAGFANYDERNRDYRTISHGLRFQRNRSIEDHDTIIWLGDFNYRIGLNDDKVRRLIAVGDLDTLYQNDQLNLQMVAGQTFPFYSEARITFMPTYKYNNGTDEYDSSEKARIPAWCDRVLRKGDNLRQISYNTAPLRFSDHRPVYATFQCTISVIDKPLKEALSHEIYNKRRIEVGEATANALGRDIEDEELLDYDSIAPGLPPASSDRRKWWLNNGLPARSNIASPQDALIPNPWRPSNPFTPGSEPDWIVDPKTTRQQSPSDGGTTQITPGESFASVPPKFAPPFARPRRLPLTPAHISLKETTSAYAAPMRTASFGSSPSSSFAITRKNAPPVPKKPMLLTSSDQRRVDSGLGETAKSASSRVPPASPPNPRKPTLTSDDVEFLTFARRNAEVSRTPSRGQTLLPPLPRRISRPLHEDPGASGRPHSTPRPGGAVTISNGLLDVENDGAQNIPSLRPLRRN